MNDIRKLSDAIAREFNPHRIVLFGSHARGDAREDSDVDLLVVMPYRGHAAYKAAEICRRLNPRFAVDLLVRTEREIERRLSMGDFFVQEIIGQGQVLYESHNGRMGSKGRGRLRQQRSRIPRSKGA